MKEYIVTKQNFASVLNLGYVTKESLNKLNKVVSNYTQEVSEMIIQQNEQQETIEQVETASEIIGVGADVGKEIINKTVNEGLTQSISFNFSDNSNIEKQFAEQKERVGKLETKKLDEEKDSADFLRKEITRVVQENEKLLRNRGVFTEEEFIKILHSKENNLPEMFDYNFGGGNFSDMLVDIEILYKCSSCTILNEKDEYVFKDFLIVDGCGTAVNPKLINKDTKKYLINFGLQEEVGEKNLKAFQLLNARIEVTDKASRLSKLKGNANVVKLVKRMSGANEVEKEFKEYTEQLQAITASGKIATKIINTTEGIAKIGYKGIKAAKISKAERAYEKAKQEAKNATKIVSPDEMRQKMNTQSGSPLSEKVFNEKNSKLNDVNVDTQKEALKQYKKLKKERKKFSSFEERAYAIRHPIKYNLNKFGNRISEKIKSSKIAKSINNKIRNSAFFSVSSNIQKRIKNVLSVPFKVVGKAVTPIALIVREIIKKTVLLMLPFLIVLIIFMVIGFSASGSLPATSVVAIMPLANQSDFDNYQKKYDSLDDSFLMSLEDYLGGYAVKTNLKGEKIRYGINGENNEDEMKNNDFHNGMYYRFIVDEEHAGRSSNIEDLICIMAIMMTQSQSDYPDVAEKCLEWLYDISHSYTYTESPLYACNSACHKIHYKCTDHFHEYSDTDIKYNPFHALSQSGGEYEIKKTETYCEVCKLSIDKPMVINTNCFVSGINNPTYENCYGCVEMPSECFHGNDGNMGREHPLASSYRCSNYSARYDCPGHSHYDKEGNERISYCQGPLGCQGYYECNGHSHWKCDGHDYKCCMGHTDIQMNVQIKFYEEVKEIINNYNFGTNDILYQEMYN